MRYCLEAALPLGLRVLILDRPNPIGGEIVEGPGAAARVRKLCRGASVSPFGTA